MLPKETFDKKISFFNSSEKKLAELSVKVQEAVWIKIEAILASLDDNIVPDDTTLKIIQKLEQTAYKEYIEQSIAITNQVPKDFTTINKLNDVFYLNFAKGLEDRFKEGKDYSETLRRTRLGLTEKGLQADGFLSKFASNPEVLSKIQQQTYKAISSPISKQALRTSLKNLVLGTETSSGISEAQVNTYVTDTYNEFDSLTQKIRANRLGMVAALYANSIIRDSRCFCRNRFNKVWTVDEISKWKSSTKSSATKSGEGCLAIYETTRYDPFTHRGGYNCRHVYRYVPKSTAIRFRPELIEYYNKLDAKGIKYI